MGKNKVKRKQPNPVKSLQRGVQRWQNRKVEKEKQRHTLPTHLPSAIKQAPVQKKKPRRPVSRKPDDDKLTSECISNANRRLSENDRAPKRLKMIEHVSREDQLRQRKLRVNTYMKPLAEFVRENPETSVKQLDESDETRNRIACETFPDLVDPVDLLDAERDNWTYRNSERIRNGILASPKDVVSAKHVAKVLAAPYGFFEACIMAENGRCMAQAEACLRHPMTKPDSAPPPCMGYVTPEEMRAAEAGLLNQPLAGNYCELCQRHKVNYEVKRRILGVNITEHEIPSHYYRSDMPGEYSKDSMLQPSVVKGVTRTDGIFGDMRAWNTSDYVPVVGVIERDEQLISSYIDMKTYKKRESASDGRKYVPAWREVGGMYSLNERALLEHRRIDPYVRSVIDTEHENSIETVLREYFKQRGSENDDYSHLFRDLRECATDPDLLARAYPAPPDQSITRWLPNCLHDITNEPDFDTHRIYYALLVKINACSEFLRRWVGEDLQRSPLAHIIEKVQLYHDAHLPLLHWMDEHKRIDDASLEIPIYDSNVGFDTNTLFQLYPKTPVHFRIRDVPFTPIVRRDYTRKTPLTILTEYYIDCFDKRINGELYEDLPLTRHLISGLVADNLNKTAYLRLSTEFERLCTFYDVPMHSMWPALPNIACDEYEALSSDEKRRDWRVKHNSAVIENMKHAFDTVLNILRSRSNTYHDLLNNFSYGIISDFQYTLKWIRSLTSEERSILLQHCNYFASVFPENSNIISTDTHVNGMPWEQHLIFFTALIRVYVLEQLHSLEPWQNKRIRQSLVLLRNSHLGLVRCITEHRPALLNDTALLTPLDKVLSLFDYNKPTATRELHPGDLPNLINGLVYVNFMGECGMDHHSFIKAQFKKPKRACSGRTFSEILRQMCDEDPAFYRLTCVELELSLKGLYLHNTAVPSFARSLALDELFDNTQHPKVKQSLFTFILENQTLVMEATSESLLYMLEYAPHLRDLLHEVYQDWFEWRVNVNMDLVRRCYDETGDFTRVEEIVYGRVQLKNAELVYRHNKVSFVEFVCTQVRNFDQKRYEIRVSIESDDRITPSQRLRVERFVRRLSPDGEIHLEDLKLVGLEASALDVIAETYAIFKTTGLKRNGAKAKKDISDAAVQEQFRKLTANQYVLLSYFFETLKRHQVVRAIRISNLNILEAQTSKLCARHNASNLDDVPEYATKIAYSPCCLYIKNAFPLRPGSDASGFDAVMLDVLGDKNTCGKKPPKIKRNARVTAIRAGADSKRYDARVELAQFREEKKPSCADTEIVFVDLVGEVLYTTEMAKVHKAKRMPGEGERRKKHLSLPDAPLWITPCCGIVYSYKWSNFTANGYACGVCIENTAVAESLKAVLCTCCLQPIQGHDYEVLRIYDDVYTSSFRRLLFCTSCLRPWRRFAPHNLCVSFILRGVRNRSFVSDVTAHL